MSRNWAACPVKSCWEILQYEINYNIKLSKTIIRIKKIRTQTKRNRVSEFYKLLMFQSFVSQNINKPSWK